MPSKTVKIVADANIPLVHELFGQHALIIQKPGAEICAEDCQNADGLLTRTITQVDRALLDQTPVRWVGSATAGLDHIDIEYLDEAHIALADAKGANAVTVEQYVISCLAHFYQNGSLQMDKPKRAGVIGVGHCGSRVANRLTELGFEVLCHDPPRKEKEPGFHSVPLEAFRDLDVISLHTPLTSTGKHPTHHLVNDDFLKRQKSGCILINASRGAVADNAALLRADHLLICLDVWENEPQISQDLLRKIAVCTPHIAGYSQQAKARATQQLYEQACVFFNWSKQDIPTPPVTTERSDWDIRALNALNPTQATELMRKALLSQKGDLTEPFESLRQQYLSRQEYTE